jgi:large repetitive protein
MVAVMVDGTLFAETMAGTNGAWSYSPASTLPNGSYTITAQSVDIAGNLSPISAAFNATIETVNSPVIAGVSLVTTKSGLLGLLGLGQSQQSLSVIGTAPANDSVKVFLSGNLLGTANSDAQGNWSFNYVPSSSTVPGGTYAFAAIAGDASGNVSTTSPCFQLQVGGGSTADTPKYASGALFGRATAGSLVTIVDGNVVLGVVTADSSGNWQFIPTLSKGKHNIMAEATSSAGYTSLLSGSLNVSA